MSSGPDVNQCECFFSCNPYIVENSNLVLIADGNPAISGSSEATVSSVTASTEVTSTFEATSTTLVTSTTSGPSSTSESASSTSSSSSTTSSSSPTPTTTHLISTSIGNTSSVDSYTIYWGDGSSSAGWPSIDSWISFNSMFAANKYDMLHSCCWNKWGDDNSDDEIEGLRQAIVQVASETGVDARYILAVLMQESKGCVRVYKTDGGVRNPGLMQCHDGAGTCNSDRTGEILNPCPNSMIMEMIQEGTAGHAYDDGYSLAKLLDNDFFLSNLYLFTI
ncbi:hypothetical protein G7Y89_g10332 [Cudoniella acicularis]|uniref:Uncharacterized protein n=1 Tax=Cudoniella acicularis TaxID=354080 RepID=A0A8H4REK5_9HELO|nr:hypothetical protein G7Y89_g10332 [Cudoniella acicularis]